MEFLLHLFMVGGFCQACPKSIFSPGAQLLFPVLDLNGMYVKLFGSFRQGAITPDSGQATLALHAGE